VHLTESLLPSLRFAPLQEFARYKLVLPICEPPEVANGTKFVNYFMHNNLITVDGTKMGKSLGNFITLEDLFAKFNPMYVRYFILQFHYRSPVDFTFDAIKSAGEQFEKLCQAYKTTFELAEGKTKKIESKEVSDLISNFEINALEVKEGLSSNVNVKVNDTFYTEQFRFVDTVKGKDKTEIAVTR